MNTEKNQKLYWKGHAAGINVAVKNKETTTSKKNKEVMNYVVNGKPLKSAYAKGYLDGYFKIKKV